MKITKVSALGLRGATPEGGWSEELKEEDCVHTLVFVETDEGVTGIGSVFTNDGLVLAALEVLRPLLIGQSAIEPERVSEWLHQNTFWMGRGRQHHAYDQRHRHCDVGYPGQSYRAAGGPIAGRALPGKGPALCLLADGPAGPAAR